MLHVIALTLLVTLAVMVIVTYTARGITDSIFR